MIVARLLVNNKLCEEVRLCTWCVDDKKGLLWSQQSVPNGYRNPTRSPIFFPIPHPTQPNIENPNRWALHCTEAEDSKTGVQKGNVYVGIN